MSNLPIEEPLDSEFIVKFRELKKLRNNRHMDEPEFDERVEQLAADTYGHTPADGWCCACDADIAFMKPKPVAAPSIDELNRKVVDICNTFADPKSVLPQVAAHHLMAAFQSFITANYIPKPPKSGELKPTTKPYTSEEA